MDSMFDKFGGHYVVMVDGIEFSRHAPSSVWTFVSKAMEEEYGDSFSYKFVVTD